MYQEMKYLVVSPDWNNSTQQQNELLHYLQNGWSVVSACGAGEVVHYIIKENKPAVVKKAMGRPKKVQEQE